MGQLDNKTLMVTGGTSGIGRASALRFASEGARVAIIGRRQEEGKHVVKEIADLGQDALFIQADLAELDAIPQIIDDIVKRFGRIDGAFNNAGVGGGAPVGAVTNSDWDRIMDTNLKAAFFCLQAEAVQMVRQGGGAILLNASVLSVLGAATTTAYAASKGALVSLARTAAVELGPSQVRVNALSPGVTRTPLTATRIRIEPNGREAHPLAPNVPLGRIAEPDEIAAAAAFLLSDQAAYITGQNLVVDGGLSAA